MQIWLPVTLQAITVAKNLKPETCRGMCEYMHMCICNKEGKNYIALKDFPKLLVG